MRERISLDGTWQFIIDPKAELRIDKLDGIRNWRQITVPSCWEAEFEDLVNYDGVAWYRRTLEIPAEWLQTAHNGKSRIIVHFDAVDYFARVWLNEYLLGEHEGGYLPFEFEIGAEALTALGVTEPSTSLTLTVQVIDPTDDRLHFPHYPMDEIPCGKQRWYINVGGIWQSVWLEHRPHIYVRNVHITPNDNLNGINVRVWLNHAPDVNLQGECIIISPDGNECVREVVSVEAGCTSFDFYVTIPAPQLWHPECPNLYKLRIELTNGDAYETAFGLRTVTTCGGCVYLNGEPIYLIGALDQDFYPDTIYRAPSDAYIEEQFKLAKQMGLNLLRCHIKIPERRYLDCADRIGLLIWYEVPSWWRFGERAKLRIRKHIQGMVERDYNHPSLIAYSIVNESWGVRLAEQELHRQWLVEMVNWLKQLDPTRLVIDNSPCRGNFHIKTDINDFHVYYNSPDHDAEFVQWVCDFDSRPEWTFSPHGDAAPKGDEPLIVSEFGLWGLPDIEALINHYGGKPWWFATGSDACRPEGVIERFNQHSLKDAFTCISELSHATQEHQAEALQFQIEQIRKQAHVVGYVITEFTDLTWECNGLLDFQRQPKAVAKCMAEFQSQDVLIAEWEQPCIWSGEPVRMHIYLSHYSSRDVRNAELHWHLHDEHDGDVIAENNVGGIHVRRAHVERIVTTELLMPDVTSPQWFRLDAQLRNADEVIASTHKRLLVIPREWRVWDDALPSSVYVHDPQGWFGDLLERLGVSGATIADKPTDAKFIITASLDEVMQCELKRGASVLWIVERARAVPSPLPEFTILDRRHKGRWGDWCSSFIWLASELRRELSAPAILCAALRDIVPNCVIEFDETRALHREGCELKPHVRMLAGIFVGWLHHQAGIAVEFGIGDGKLLVTTFPLASKWLRSPAATAMLRCMMKRLMHK